MISKRNIKKVLRNSLAGLLCIAPLMGVAHAEEKEDKVKVSASSTFASDYVGRSGFITGSGPVNQNMISLEKGRLSGYVWSNYDLEDEELHEVDVGIDYTIPVNDKLSLRAGYQRWQYPSGLLGEYDNALEVGASYSGPVNANASLTHLIGHDDVESGQMVHGTVSKSFKLPNTEVSITPKVSGAYLRDFFGVNEPSHITPGLSVSYNKGRMNAEGFINRQIAISDKIEDRTYFGIKFGVKF